MTYSAIESSVNQGAPIELYLFVRGTQEWYFSSCANSVTYLTKEFEPTSIRRDRVKQDTDPFKNDLRVTFPRENEFANEFLNYAPEQVTTLTIYRGHAGDSEFISYWKGRIIGAEISGNEITINCESVFTSIRRPGLRAVFEYTCRHSLYGVNCRASASSYEISGNVSSISSDGLTIEIPESSSTDGYYTGGIFSFGSTSRFIISHTGINIVLSRPINGLIIGDACKIYPGCNHARDTCKNKFNNLDNYGGFPWIPTRNPFDGSSIV